MLEVDMEIIFKRPRGYSVPSGCGKGSGKAVADRTIWIIVADQLGFLVWNKEIFIGYHI